jgi:hypothetical protein
MALPHEPGRGSNSKYQQGCRCPECRNAHRIELRIWRTRQWLVKVAARRLDAIEAEMKAATRKNGEGRGESGREA